MVTAELGQGSRYMLVPLWILGAGEAYLNLLKLGARLWGCTGQVHSFSVTGNRALKQVSGLAYNFWRFQRPSINY